MKEYYCIYCGEYYNDEEHLNECYAYKAKLLQDELSQVKAERDRLRELLDKYGQHKLIGNKPCSMYKDLGAKCTCGFDKALTANKEES